MKKTFLALLAFFSICIFTANIQAASLLANCKTYRDAYCSGIRNQTELKECLQKNASKIPCACRESMKIKTTFINKAECSADRSKFCEGVSRKGGALIKCLSENQAQLSCECRENLLLVKEKLREHSSNCEKDRRTYCSDTQPGEGRIKKCLKQHKDEISPACRDGLKTVKKYTL